MEGWNGLPTDFGGGIRQRIERAGLAGARFPDEANEGIAGHLVADKYMYGT